LHDAGSARQRHQEHTEDRGQQQRDAHRQVSMSAEIRNFGCLAVFQDKDQKQQEHDGEGHCRNPQSTDP
jgi:hypothetical protein